MALEFLGSLGNFGGSIFGSVYQGVILFCLVAAFGGIGWYIIRLKKFNHYVRIFEKDSMGNIIEKPLDKGGIFLDRKTKFRLFLLRKNKVGLQPDSIPFIQKSNGKKVVYLMQNGIRNFQYLGKPTISENPGLIFNVHDEDIAWALNAWEKFKMPTKNDMLRQFLPYVGIAVFGMVIIIMIYLILDKGSVMVDAANAFKEASKELAKASLGTQVIE